MINKNEQIRRSSLTTKNYKLIGRSVSPNKQQKQHLKKNIHQQQQILDRSE